MAKTTKKEELENLQVNINIDDINEIIGDSKIENVVEGVEG